jgi:hypothetical protein
MNPKRRLFTAGAAILGMAAFAGSAVAADKDDSKGKGNGKGKGKANHKNGKQLLGDKIKKNGKHALETVGPHSVSVDVKDGKIAGMHVKHSKKGELPVTKYKTKTKMASADVLQFASMQHVQLQDLGTVYIGYAYYDEYGYEEIYWYPYEMIYDGDTGAIEYIPIY